MSTIALPSDIAITQFRMVPFANQRVGASPGGGSEQAVDLLNDRWKISFVSPGRDGYAHGAVIEAFIGAMRGQVNTVALYHNVRPAPVGTVRGTLTLSASVAQGASSIIVTGCSPSTGTVLAGDMFGVGGLLLMAAADAVAVAGVVTIALANRVRVAQSAGASVTWDRPTVLFRLLDTSGVNYVSDKSEDVTFEFAEAITS